MRRKRNVDLEVVAICNVRRALYESGDFRYGKREILDKVFVAHMLGILKIACDPKRATEIRKMLRKCKTEEEMRKEIAHLARQFW